MKIDTKIKVFISSNCGVKKFDRLRKQIKTELENTQLISVYLFESRAKTLPPIPSYIMELEDCDVCVFLLEDGPIPDGVRKEIVRAKKINKKSLYYFCGAKAKETAILKHGLVESKFCTFNTVSSFKEFLKSVDDLIDEIIKIYHYYCSGWMIDKETSTEQLSIPQTDDSISAKSILKSSDYSKNIISNFLFDEHHNIENTDDFDLYCSKFLEILLAGKSIRDFNLSLLLDSIKEKQSAKYFEITSLRWYAIQKFFLGDKAGCLVYLKNALEVAKHNTATEWIIKDILIDLRNLNAMIDNEKGSISVSNEAQLELDTSVTTLYYPVLDRYDKDLYVNFLERDIKESLKSPYTVTFGNSLNGLINNLTNTYMVSIYNGSLTHIRLLYKRLKDCAFYLCKNYSNWFFRIALCKAMIVECNQKEFERMWVVFKDILERINDKDAKEIFDFTFNLPTAYERNSAILTAFAHVGSYLNDKDFESASTCVLEILNQWLKNPNVFLGPHIFSALQKNAQRMDSEKILNFAISALKSGFKRFLSDIYKTITYLDLTTCSHSSLNNLEEVISTYLNENPDFSFARIDNLLVKLKKQNLCSNALFDILKDKYPDKYKEIILLNTTTEADEINSFLDGYTSEIERRNRTQGVNGYIGYTTNPYQVIESLIKDSAKLNELNAQRIVDSALNTVIAKKQTIEDKLDAIRLIFVVINRYRFQQEYLLHLREVLDGNLSNSLEFGKIFCNTTQFTLQFGVNLLRIRFGTVEYITDLESQSIELYRTETIDKIECLRLLVSYLDGLDFSTIESKMKFILKNIILTARLSETHDIVYYSTIAILNLLPYEKDIGREQLYKVMNNDNCFIKNLVVQHLSEIKATDETLYRNIVEQGMQDNNFFVRNNTKKIVRQLEETA